MLSGSFDEPVPPLIGGMFVIIPVILMIGAWALAGCILIAGWKLGQHRSYMYCLVVAAIECFFMPFGTVLGVFTIIVLMRPSVKRLFGVSCTDDGATDVSDVP